MQREGRRIESTLHPPDETPPSYLGWRSIQRHRSTPAARIRTRPASARPESNSCCMDDLLSTLQPHKLPTRSDGIRGQLLRWNDQKVVHGVDVRPKSPRLRPNDFHGFFAELGRWDLPCHLNRHLRF